MCDAPRTLVKMVRGAVGDQSLTPQRVKESIARLWAQQAAVDPGKSPTRGTGGTRSVRVWPRRKSQVPHEESLHTSGKSQEVLELYRAISTFCFSVDPGAVEKRILKKSVNFLSNKRVFCSLHILRGGLRVWLQLKYTNLQAPPLLRTGCCQRGSLGHRRARIGDQQPVPVRVRQGTNKGVFRGAGRIERRSARRYALDCRYDRWAIQTR